MSRTIWLVDAAYLMKAAPDRFDYLKLKTQLETVLPATFAESYYLNSTPNPPTDAQDSFHTWLKTAPPHGPKMRVKLYKLKNLHSTCPSCNHEFDREVQKGVDVAIATLAVRLAAEDLYDQLILSAGDGDFEDAISFVKHKQKKFVLTGFNNSVSADLQSYADTVIWLDDHWNNIKK